MKIGITKLRLENVAPENVKALAIYDGDTRVGTVSVDKMRLPDLGAPLYSFGIISDLHIFYATTAWDPITKFDNALSFFEGQGCAFCVACGDLTNTGFYLRTSENAAGTEYLDERQFAKFKEICDAHTIDVPTLCGNHESYYGMPITSNLALLETYTGRGELAYTVAYGDDLFILVGQPSGSVVMRDEDFEWLGNTLEENKNRRCFVFVHSHIDDNVEGGVEDSGNPGYARENSIFGYWGTAKTQNFIALMQKYPNAILFHGHTHIMFEAQEFDTDANYTEKNGFKSVHVPSSGAPRKLVSEDGTWEAQDGESQGYIVDVYADCVVLKGYDLVNQKYVPIAQYRINV